jgi:6-phosphogluconolactonase (cycloisomerase 2 family)
MMVTLCSTGSPGPAHLLADLEHGLVLTANYGGGTLTLFSLTQQGRLDRLQQTEVYGQGCRDASHPHEVQYSAESIE